MIASTIKGTVLIVVIFTCCTCSRINKTMDVDELKYVFIDSTIKKNGIDSVFFTARNRGWRTDTVNIMVFDSLGRLISESLNVFGRYRYSYDSMGLRKNGDWHSFDISGSCEITNHFFSDSLVLYEHWKEIEYEPKEFSNIYRFNKEGQLIEMEGRTNIVDRFFFHIQSDIGSLRKGDHKAFNHYPNNTKLYYEDGKKVTEETYFSDYGQNIQKFSTCRYFYTDHRLDSTILHIEAADFDVVTCFDANGLAKERVYNDTLLVKFVYTRH
jgi:hypothetical protein